MCYFNFLETLFRKKSKSLTLRHFFGLFFGVKMDPGKAEGTSPVDGGKP